MLKKNLEIILAVQKTNNGIGLNGKIPWHSPLDMKHFKTVTTTTNCPEKKNAIVMGRKTFKSLGKPLANRINYVITSNVQTTANDCLFFDSIQPALQHASDDKMVESIFIIGGATIYDFVFDNYRHFIDKIYLTTLEFPNKIICDTFVDTDKFLNQMTQISTTRMCENFVDLTFTLFRNTNFEELEYLNLVKKILENGETRPNRTGVNTIGTFGEKMTFDISTRIPFLTTKRVAWKTVIKELLWFISGDTNNQTLVNQGVHIWDGNSSREYLDSLGFTNRQVGDLGPVYSHQWRHFGAEYIDCNTDYGGKGIDQLQYVINLLKTDPFSRRIILSSWNPASQHLMCLPPCHILAQWYVSKDGFLDCQLYQRSGDIGLGVPFNIASYSVLTVMLAHLTNLKPRKFIHILGDAHIYENHIEPLKEQIKRQPYPFPYLIIKGKVDNIDDFTIDHFELNQYTFHSQIKMDMVV